jgi:pantetheine-phosphate adenylyltransferase
VFLPSTSKSSFLASRYIRDMARFGRDVSDMVPPPVASRLAQRP